MRHNAPFVVKRLAPMIGRPEGARRISVDGNAYSLNEAITIAGEHTRRRARLAAMIAREGVASTWQTQTIRWCDRCATWIERRGSSATGGRAAA